MIAVTISKITLGGKPLDVAPTDVRWNFSIKTQVTNTLGGRVVQVIGVNLSDLTITGSFGRGPGRGEGWQAERAFNTQVKSWVESVVAQASKAPLRFSYPVRGWDFQVYVKSISPVTLDPHTINPKVTLTLFPVEAGALDVVTKAKDSYISRLMNGVGWKQSVYNGPLQDNKGMINGKSIVQDMADKVQQIMDGASLASVTSPAGAQAGLSQPAGPAANKFGTTR